MEASSAVPTSLSIMPHTLSIPPAPSIRTCTTQRCFQQSSCRCALQHVQDTLGLRNDHCADGIPGQDCGVKASFQLKPFSAIGRLRPPNPGSFGERSIAGFGKWLAYIPPQGWKNHNHFFFQTALVQYLKYCFEYIQIFSYWTSWIFKPC